MFIESGYIDNSSIIFEEYENTNNDIITELCAFDLIIQQKLNTEMELILLYDK